MISSQSSQLLPLYPFSLLFVSHRSHPYHSFTVSHDFIDYFICIRVERQVRSYEKDDSLFSLEKMRICRSLKDGHRIFFVLFRDNQRQFWTCHIYMELHKIFTLTPLSLRAVATMFSISTWLPQYANSTAQQIGLIQTPYSSDNRMLTWKRPLIQWKVALYVTWPISVGGAQWFSG